MVENKVEWWPMTGMRQWVLYVKRIYSRVKIDLVERHRHKGFLRFVFILHLMRRYGTPKAIIYSSRAKTHRQKNSSSRHA